MNIKQESVLLTVKDVVKFAQVGRSFVYQEVAAGRFPKPVKLGRSVRWLKSEVQAWVEGKALNREACTEGKEILDGAHESDINEGGPAFPGYGETGMTLRDYFAAKAMQGLLAGTLTPEIVWSQSDVAETAYNVADAMIKERDAK
jgi:predicted DNA-binding transcriptional regulator AlpA